MKNSKLLSVVAALLLVVATIGCAPLQRVGGDEDDYTETRRSAPNRVYVDDPYYGTIVLERDPFSGRYFQIGTIGGMFSPYQSGFYRGGFNNPYYGGGYYRRAPQQNAGRPKHQPNAEERARQGSEARRKILGEGGSR